MLTVVPDSIYSIYSRSIDFITEKRNDIEEEYYNKELIMSFSKLFGGVFVSLFGGKFRF